MEKQLYTLGIDIGSTTVKIAILDEAKQLIFSDYRRHFANIRETLRDLFKEAYAIHGDITVSPMITGSGGLTIDSSGYPVAPSSWQGASSSGRAEDSSTMFTIPEGSQLGTVTIRGRSIRVYEGTTDSNLLKGAGHFIGTSAWDGNVCLCGHNRGPNAWFSDLIRLTSGEQITYQTPLGVKIYQVTGTRIVSVNDPSPLTGSVENQLTLVTCVANRPDVRLIVTAQQAL